MSTFLDNGWDIIWSLFMQYPEQRLVRKLCEQALKREDVFPKNPFRVFEMIKPEQVKVIILGESPYHSQGFDTGIAYSVPEEYPIPPTLWNIFSEIANEYGPWEPSNGNLNHWVYQGVLLLNAVLTVEEGLPGSHRDLGWEIFTGIVIRELIAANPDIIVVTWGDLAKDRVKNMNLRYWLESASPSPFFAHKGFFGNGHFKIINSILEDVNQNQIKWTNV